MSRRMGAVELGLPDDVVLTELVQRQRWFGAKSRSIVRGRVVDSATLQSPSLVGTWVLFEIEFADGGSELYQLLYAGSDEAVATGANLAIPPALAQQLVLSMRVTRRLEAADGVVAFHAIELPDGLELREPRSIDAEQSNSSIVFGDQAILKVYRRLEGGRSPELEMLHFLSARGFANVPPLLGWYDYAGPRITATLGILQQFVRERREGWEFALESLAGDPAPFLASTRRLGEVTGLLHSALASDVNDPDFRPEKLDAEALAGLSETVEDEARAVFGVFPTEVAALDPIRGRGDEVLQRLRTLRGLGAFGVVIRHHGDYHLGQVLWVGTDWLVLDFEGEPARTLPGRRRKRSPFRDVAGMLRSFAYAAETSRARSIPPPSDWEDKVRSEFVEGYLAAVEPSLLPPTRVAREALLAAFELEKALYELRYELDNRPAWVGVPVAGIVRALDSPVWR